METATLSAIVKCICSLLVLGLNCSNSVFGKRILYGQVADPAMYRFVVHLTYEGDKKYTCGGAVISNHFILTAAHCLVHRTCKKIEIGPSTWQRGDVATYFGHQCHPHFQYHYNNVANLIDDIGLLETEDDLLQNPQITLYDLPIPDTTYAVGTPALIVGWGKTEDNIHSNALLDAEVRVFDWDDCNRVYKLPERIPRGSFCTQGDPPMYPGACIGDSGGPVIIDETLAGVVAGVILDDADDVCIAGFPSMITLVSEYVPWIMIIADLERRGKYSRHGRNAPVPEPLGNYTSTAGQYQ